MWSYCRLTRWLLHRFRMPGWSFARVLLPLSWKNVVSGLLIPPSLRQSLAIPSSMGLVSSPVVVT